MFWKKSTPKPESSGPYMVKHQGKHDMACPACGSYAQDVKQSERTGNISTIFWKCWACGTEYKSQIAVKEVPSL